MQSAHLITRAPKLCWMPATIGLNLMIVANAAKGKQMYSDDGGVDSKGDKMSGMNSTMFNMITQMVGSGMNKAANGTKADLATTPILDAVDIAGYNYASGRYGMEGDKHPDRGRHYIITITFIADYDIMLACVCHTGVKFKSNDNNKCGGYKR